MLLKLSQNDKLHISENPLKKNTIEFSWDGEQISYRVIGLNDKEIRSWIVWNELPENFPKDNKTILDNKQHMLPIFLEILSKYDHAHNYYHESNNLYLYLYKENDNSIFYYLKDDKKKYYLCDEDNTIPLLKEASFHSSTDNFLLYNDSQTIQSILNITSKRKYKSWPHTYSYSPMIERPLPNARLDNDHKNGAKNWRGFSVIRYEDSYEIICRSAFNPDRELPVKMQLALMTFFRDEFDLKQKNKIESRI